MNALLNADVRGRLDDAGARVARTNRLTAPRHL
jgi:hypothetical protein